MLEARKTIGKICAKMLACETMSNVYTIFLLHSSLQNPPDVNILPPIFFILNQAFLTLSHGRRVLHTMVLLTR